MKLETKKNSERRRKQALSNYVKSTIECQEFLKTIIKNEKNITVDFLMFLAKEAGFRMKDIERSYYYLKDNDFDFSKYFILGGRLERILEQQSIIPFFEKNIPNCIIKKQVFIKYENKHHGIADLVLYILEKPFLIIETKTHFLKRSRRHILQALNYSKALNTSFFVITNGFRYDWYYRNEYSTEKISDKNQIPSMILEKLCSFKCQTV